MKLYLIYVQSAVYLTSCTIRNNRQTRLEINFKAHIRSTLKRTKNFAQSSLEDFVY